MSSEHQITAEDCLSVNNANLIEFAEQFRTAVDLFALLERGGGPPHIGIFGGPFIQYRMVAARDGAMAIYHFGCSLDAIKSIIPQSTSATRLIKLEDIDAVIDLFNSNFPHASVIRNAIAHAGELYNSVPKLKTSQQRKAANFHGGSSGEGGMLTAALFERTYTLGKAGRVFSFTIDHGTAILLYSLINQVSQAFQAYHEDTQPPS